MKVTSFSFGGEMGLSGDNNRCQFDSDTNAKTNIALDPPRALLSFNQGKEREGFLGIHGTPPRINHWQTLPLFFNVEGFA